MVACYQYIQMPISKPHWVFVYSIAEVVLSFSLYTTRFLSKADFKPAAKRGYVTAAEQHGLHEWDMRREIQKI